MENQVSPLKETYEVCALLEGAAEALYKTREDNKLSATDAFYFVPLIDLGRSGLKDAQKIISEFKSVNGELFDAGITRLVKATVYFTQEVAELFKIFGKK